MMTTPFQENPGAESKFGTQGYAAQSYDGPLEEPKAFRTLKMLTLVALAVYVLSAIVSTAAAQSQAFADATRQMLEELGMPSSEIQTMVDQQSAGTIIQQVVMGVLGIALFLLVYFGLAKRKNWARVTGIVFAIPGIVSMLAGTLLIVGLLIESGGLGILSVVLTVLYALVSIYWLVLAFNPAVKRYLQQ